MNANPTATAKQPKARKPAPKPERRIALLERPSADTDGWFALRITFQTTMARTGAVRVETWNYLAREIPADGMGHGCRGFEVEKLGPDLLPTGEIYHVLLDTRDGYSSCDCRGGERHGNCKHREGIEALVKTGHLPQFRSGSDMKRHAPEELERHLASIAEHFGTPTSTPEPWEYPDEPPQLDHYADFDPAELI